MRTVMLAFAGCLALSCGKTAADDPGASSVVDAQDDGGRLRPDGCPVTPTNPDPTCAVGRECTYVRCGPEVTHNRGIYVYQCGYRNPTDPNETKGWIAGSGGGSCAKLKGPDGCPLDPPNDIICDTTGKVCAYPRCGDPVSGAVLVYTCAASGKTWEYKRVACSEWDAGSK